MVAEDANRRAVKLVEWRNFQAKGSGKVLHSESGITEFTRRQKGQGTKGRSGYEYWIYDYHK